MITTYEELEGSPSEEVDEQGCSATRRIKVPWAQRWALVDEWLTGLYDYQHATGRQMLVRSASVAPFGGMASSGNDNNASYSHALVTFKFNTPGKNGGEGQQDQNGDLFAESIEPTAEFLTLDYRLFAWGGGADAPPLVEAEAPGRIMKGIEYKLTRYQVIQPKAAWIDLVGCVNTAPVVCKTLAKTFEVGTLLYNPPTFDRTINSRGSSTWTVKQSMTYKPTGWNRFWRAQSQQYESIYVRRSGTILTLYAYGDFGQI